MTDRCPSVLLARGKARFGFLALGLLAASFITRPVFAQDELGPASSSTDIENERPPDDAPKPKKAEIVEEKPAADSIKDNSPKRRRYGISLDMHVPWLEGIGVGFKIGAEIPVAHNGFIPSINDSFSIEPRFLMAYQSWNSFTRVDDLKVLTFTPAVAAVWSFHFKANLRAYFFVSFGYSIASNVNYTTYNVGDLNRFYHDAGPGLFWDFASHWSLRAELGYAAMRVGISYMI